MLGLVIYQFAWLLNNPCSTNSISPTGRRCVIKDCVIVDEGAVVTDDTVMPPFTRWAGSPARIVEELPESMSYVRTVLSDDFIGR